MNEDRLCLDLDLVEIISVESIKRLGWSDPAACKIYWRLPGSNEAHVQIVNGEYKDIVNKIWTAKELNKNKKEELE